MANDIISEQLARLEYKVDLLFKKLKMKADLTDRLMPGIIRSCPFCETTVSYEVEPDKGVIRTKCGCTTGKFVINFNMFTNLNQQQVKQEDIQKLLDSAVSTIDSESKAKK